MDRQELLSNSEYWTTRIQIALYNCAERYMTENNINRTQLAKKLGVSKGYISQLLNGNYDHKLSKLAELALAFGYVPNLIFKPIEQVYREDSIDYMKLCQKLSLKTSYITSMRMTKAQRIDINHQPNKSDDTAA